MKLYFFLLTTSGYLPHNFIPNAVYIPGGTDSSVSYDRLIIEDEPFLLYKWLTNVNHKTKSIVNTWDIYCLVPEQSKDYTKQIKAFQKINKESRKDENKLLDKDEQLAQAILGPFTLKELDKLKLTLPASFLDEEGQPMLMANILRNKQGELCIPIMFAGDVAPEVSAKIKYKPSDKDCDDEIIPPEDEIFEDFQLIIEEELSNGLREIVE